MNRKNILVVLFLMFISIKGFSKEEHGLMPYMGLSRTNSEVELLGENENVTGYEIGGEYQYFEKDALKLSARLGLRNINADATNLFANYEVGMNVLTVGQTVAYDMDLAGNTDRRQCQQDCNEDGTDPARAVRHAFIRTLQAIPSTGRYVRRQRRPVACGAGVGHLPRYGGDQHADPAHAPGNYARNTDGAAQSVLRHHHARNDRGRWWCKEHPVR